MKLIFAPAILAVLFVSSNLLAQDSASNRQIDTLETSEGDAKLAKLLEGRVAGEAQSCLPAFGERGMTIIDETALVFDFGSTIYVNVPDDAHDLNDRDLLVTRRIGSRMCSSDTVQTEDSFTRTYTGNIFLNDFVPYTRSASEDGD